MGLAEIARYERCTASGAARPSRIMPREFRIVYLCLFICAMDMQGVSEIKVSHTTAAPAVAPGRLDFMDGIRGAAAFWVLIAHCMIWGGWYGIPLPNPKVAVDIFMLVSGYLMFHLAEERAEQEPPGRMASAFKFSTRRFFRIAPLYYLVLVCMFALGGSIRTGAAALQHANLKHWVGTQYYPLPLDYSPASFLMHVTFLFGLEPAYAASVGLPDWSIGLEMQFYAVFPLLWMLFCRLRPVAATLLIGGGWMLCNKLIAYPQFPEPSFLPLKLDLFLAGMLLASANRDFVPRPVDAALQLVLAVFLAARHPASVVAAALLMCLMVSVTAESEFLLWRARDIVSPILCNRLTRFMSEMSYGVYLGHGLVIYLLGGWLYSQSAVLQLRPVFRTTLLTSITVVGSGDGDIYRVARTEEAETGKGS
jgi:peptidoglycan/LPS O-acetylase OafA/YrhL